VKSALALLVCCLVALPACDPSSDCVPPPSPQTFEVGTGEECFQRVAPGDEVIQWSGSQGGYHLFAALGCTDCPEETVVTFTLVDPETGELIPGTYPDNSDYVPFDLDEDWPQAVRLQVSLPGGFDGDPLPRGTPIRLELKAYSSYPDEVLHEGSFDATIGPTRAWDP
jgi:hypothetical protein